MSIIYYYTLTIWVEPWPDHLEIILKIVVLVTVMTLIIMPLLTRLFAGGCLPPDSGRGRLTVGTEIKRAAFPAPFRLIDMLRYSPLRLLPVR